MARMKVWQGMSLAPWYKCFFLGVALIIAMGQPAVHGRVTLPAMEVWQGMDLTADPCENFYQYVCGNWTLNHQIPEGKQGYSKIDEAADLHKQRLKELLERPLTVSDTRDIRNLKYMYQSCKDEDQRAQFRGMELRALVEELGPWPLMSPERFSGTADLESLLARLALMEIYPLIKVRVFEDLTWSRNVIFVSYAVVEDRLQGNYTRVSEYFDWLLQLAVYVLGVSPTNELREAIHDVVNFEIKLQEINKFIYYPDQEMEIGAWDLFLETHFDWRRFLYVYFSPADVSVTENMDILMSPPEGIDMMFDLYKNTDKSIVANYLLMSVLAANADYLSKDIRELKEPFNKAMGKPTTSQPLWEVCIEQLTEEFMPITMGRLFTKEYFPASSKAQASEVLRYVRKSMVRMIKGMTWMYEDLKDWGINQVLKQKVVVGYPDYFPEDTEHRYVDLKPWDSYFKNCLKLHRSSALLNSQKLDQPFSNTDGWSVSPALNYYKFTENEETAVVPAGLLQPPYFGANYSWSMMFGSAGWLFAKILTASLFYKGDIIKWSETFWSYFRRGGECYEYLYQPFPDFYDNNFFLTIDLRVKNTSILEVILLESAYWAYFHWYDENIAPRNFRFLDDSQAQLLFVSYAQKFCDANEAGVDRRTHPRLLQGPLSVRVVEILSNSRSFSWAFACRLGSRMNRGDRCTVW